MKSLTSNYLAASIACLCTGATARLDAAHPVADAAPVYGPLDGTLILELGFTADRIEGRTNLLAPLYRAADGKNMFFLDGNWSGKGDGNENGGAGLGFRHRFSDPDIIFGANAFYDYGDYSGRGYAQFGTGVELLSKWVDFRANGYFPDRSVNHFNRDRDSSFRETNSISTSVATKTKLIDGGEGGVTMLQTTTTTTTAIDTHGTRRRVRREQQEAPLPGFDVEIGALLPYVERVAETRLFAGYAFFDDPFGNDISCFTARLESRPVPAMIFDVQYKGDARLVDGDNHWFFGARAEIPFDLGNLLHGQSPFAGITDAFTPTGSYWKKDADSPVARNRMNEGIIRNWRPTVSDRGTQHTRVEHFDSSTSTTSTTVTTTPVPQ